MRMMLIKEGRLEGDETPRRNFVPRELLISLMKIRHVEVAQDGRLKFS